MFDGSRHELVRYSPEPDPSRDGRLVIFHHIPKCGGVTVSHLFDLSFGDRHYGRVNHAHEWPRLACSAFPADGRTQAAVSGHASWGIHALFPGRRRVMYFTMLRDPFAMCVSEYRYTRMGYGGAEDFRAFLRGAYMPDMAVRYLGNGDYGLAEERLSQAYFLFGLVERFDDSVRLFNRLLGFPDRRFPARNASAPLRWGKGPGPGEGTEEDEAAFREEFEARNRLDRRLYAFAERLFAARAAEVLAGEEAVRLTEEDSAPSPVCLEAVKSERPGDPEGNPDRAYALLRAHPDRTPAAYRGLVRYAARCGKPEEALAWMTEGAGRHPDMFRDLAWMREERGETAMALEALDAWLQAAGDLRVTNPGDASYNRALAQTRLDRARLLFGLKREAEAAGEYEAAFALDPMRFTPYCDGAPLMEESPLREALAGVERLLVLRFGPLLALAALFEALEAAGERPRTDLVIQEGVAGGCDRRGLPGEDYPVPDGRFRFDPALARRLHGRGYGAAVLCVNLDGLERFAGQMRLALAAGAERIYLFPMRNVILEAGARTLTPVPPALAERIAQGREG
mgnify:CR=1 FL=1